MKLNNYITKLLLNLFNTTIGELNNALIEHYQLENKFTAPIEGSKNGKVPPEGKIEQNGNLIEFRFHGTGCEYKVNGLILDFDYVFNSDEYKINFGPHEFKTFIQSLRENSNFLSEDEEIVARSLSLNTNTKNLPFKL